MVNYTTYHKFEDARANPKDKHTVVWMLPTIINENLNDSQFLLSLLQAHSHSLVIAQVSVGPRHVFVNDPYGLPQLPLVKRDAFEQDLRTQT